MFGALVTVLGIKMVLAGNHGMEEMIDLTIPWISKETPELPFREPFRLLIEPGGISGSPSLSTNEILDMPTDGGTNMDAPCMHLKGRPTIAEYPVSRFISPAVKLDISDKAARNRDYTVTVKDLLDWQKKYGKFPDRGILIVYTGWEEYWRNPQKYFGLSKDPEELHWPGLSVEASEWLIKNTNLNGVAIDTNMIDSGVNTNKGYPAHRPLLRKNYILTEGLVNVKKLPPTGITLYTFPIPIKESCSAPVRVVASFMSSKYGSEWNEKY